MQFSGYTIKFRAEVLKSAIAAYREIQKEDCQGNKPMYRPKCWKRKERQENRREKKTKWYQKGGNLSPIFVPATPSSELKKKFHNIVKETGLEFKVIEKSGQSLKNILQNPAPLENKQCRDRENCMVCLSNKTKGQCRKTGVTYAITCKICNTIYHGETSRSAYSRGKEHSLALDREEKDSVLYRHMSERHKDSDSKSEPEPAFGMTVTGVHQGALDRQISEAVSINNTPPSELMNSKHEFGHNPVWGVQLTANL